MKKSIICLCLICLELCFIFMPKSQSISFATTSENQTLNITSKSALLVDYASGKVVFEKNSNERLPIASMTKLATLALVFDYLDKGIIKENDVTVVSEIAAKVGGSSAFLDAGSGYKISDLIKSVIIASANDSSVALAEAVAGTEEVFVSKMNSFAKSLDLQNTNFENCTGLPSTNHYSTASDISKIYKTMCDHRLYKKYSKIWMEDFSHPSGRKTGLVNTNRLVKTYDGIEGGKTGYTDSAKFCLTASAKRDGMKLIGVVIGAESSKIRFAEMTKLLNFGFANYQNKLVVNKELPVTISSVKFSKEKLEVYPEHDCVKFLSKLEQFEFSTDFELYEIKAPVKEGAVVGKLFVFDKNNMVVDEINLIVNKSIDTQNFKQSLQKIVELW